MHVSFQHVQRQSLSTVLGFMVCAMTFSKTIMYFLAATKLCHGAHYINHNNWPAFIFVYLVPNGFWIVIPLLCLLSVGSQLVKCVEKAIGSSKRD